MKSRILSICFFVSMMSAGAAFGQQNLFYNHYYINPFLYNPSYIAPSGYTELYLNYRKQWSGISGAPTTGTISLHVPLNYKAGVAFSASQDEAGFFKTTRGHVAFSYQIYLGEKITDIHKITFGLSAGLINSRINPDDADDIQDPVVGNNNTSSMDGQFGVHYRYNGFRLGFALPQIFESKLVAEQDFNKAGIAQLNSTISSISYEFKIGTLVSFEPMFTYRTFETVDPQFEGLVSFKLSNVGWIGGAYRQDYGATALLGLNIKEKYKLGYAYEFATEQTDKIGGGTHEFQLILRLGKKQFTRPHGALKQAPTATTHAEQAKPEPEETHVAETHKPIDPVDDEPEVTENAQPVMELPRVVEQPVTNLPANTEIKTEEEQKTSVAGEGTEAKPANNAKKPNVRTLDGANLTPGHYVVVGAFEHVQNARNYAKTLKRSGYPARISFHPGKGYFIVHMDQVDSIERARELRDQYRQMSRYSFRDTWILSIE
jgi:type IX secretion system PorP/SprF family membrane protein